MRLSRLPGRYLLAAISGLLLASAFPKVGIAGLAWVVPGLMLASALGTPLGSSFRLGYVAGLVHYLASLYWLLTIPYRWHGLPLGPMVGWLALGAFLALFPATWVALMSRASSPSENRSRGVFAETWWRRHLWMLSGAALWVGLEMIITRVFNGFPWNLLGASQYQILPLIQLASLTGVYGVSFLLVWTSLAILSAGLILLRTPARRTAMLGELFLPLLVAAAAFNFGLRRLGAEPAPKRSIEVVFIQPSIPQTVIWDSQADSERFQDLLRLSQDALTNHADLLLWPEAAVPKLLRYDEQTFQATTELARSNQCWMIIGADDAVRRFDVAPANDTEFYNSSFLIGPDGRLLDYYRKRSLVMFGEYIPLLKWLPFLKFFTPIQGGFTPGKGPIPFRLENLGVKTSVLICFEDIFPALGRESAGDDTDFLVNLTNNGWFDESAAQWQHAASGLFRAVENDIPLLRCSNNGLTCWVDGRGRLQQIFHDARGTIYGPGLMRARIPLLPEGQPRNPTFYHRHGDWLGWTCVVIGLLLLGREVQRQVKARLIKQPPSH